MNQSPRRSSKKTSVANDPEKTQPMNELDRLRESEAKYRGFIENLSVMFYAAEPHPPYATIYVSPAFAQFGYALEEWSASLDLWTRALHPDDREWVLEKTEAAMRAGAETDFEYRIITSDGETCWVRDRGSFVRDEQGKIVCWQGVILDVTVRKLGEQKIQKSEKLYRTLARSIPHTAVVLFDRDCRYTLADGCLLEKHGFTREMLEGRTLREAFPPEVADQWSDYYRRALGGETIQFETESAEGSFQIYVSPVKNECGEIFAGMVMWQDITVKNYVEKNLRESERRYRDLTEKSLGLISSHDLDGILLSINEAAAKNLGYEPKELVGKPVWELMPPDDKPIFQAYLEKIKTDGEFFGTFRVLTKTGETRILKISNTLYYENGEPAFILGNAQDITTLKRAEEALRASELRYRNLFENASDLIYVRDLQGNYLSINKAAERVLGYTREEALNVNMRQVVVSEHWERARRLAADETIGGSRAAYEIDCLTKDGDRVTLEVNSSPIYKDGAVIAVQGIARDITERTQAEAALKKSEEQYRELFENANDLIYTRDLDGNFTSLNRAGEIITGYARDEVLKMHFSDIITPEYQEKALELRDRLRAGERAVEHELEIFSKDGRRITLELSSRLIFQDRQPVGVQGIGRDITERKQAEAALKNSERRYRALGEGIMHQVWTAQPDGNLDYVNERTLRFFGQTREQIIGSGWQAVVHPDDLPQVIERWTRSIATGDDYQTEFRLRRHDGEYCWHQARATAGRDQSGRIVNWFGTNTDINDRKMAEAKLSYIAGHDTLTNLPNRSKFMHHLERAVGRAAQNSSFRFAVLFLDLDRFKIVNDSLGHAVGDKLLIAFAKRLESCVRPGDVVARLGGDEFTVLLNYVHEPGDAARVASRFLEKLSAPFKLDAYEVFTSASIGVIVSDDTPREPEDFLRDADAAMYRAKESGKSRYEIFDREMHLRNMNLLQLENDLRRAIECHEFEVYYQPIVELAGGRVREFEALIRWRHPQRGLISPNEFISLAEETGLIIPMGAWILEAACRRVADWQKRFPQHRELAISVNLSAKQLLHPNLIAQVGDIIARTGIDARCLKLEVTESVVMENGDRALAVISELNRLGIQLSTDDFGTGYSSLSYLHRFPFNRLKIDRSFVSRMDSDRKSEAIVRTILLLAQNLKMEVVAEGIETASQLESLRLLGCRAGQGYLFSEPVSSRAAEQILENGLPNAAAEFYEFGEAGSGQTLELDKVQ